MSTSATRARRAQGQPHTPLPPPSGSRSAYVRDVAAQAQEVETAYHRYEALQRTMVASFPRREVITEHLLALQDEAVRLLREHGESMPRGISSYLVDPDREGEHPPYIIPVAAAYRPLKAELTGLQDIGARTQHAENDYERAAQAMMRLTEQAQERFAFEVMPVRLRTATPSIDDPGFREALRRQEAAIRTQTLEHGVAYDRFGVPSVIAIGHVSALLLPQPPGMTDDQLRNLFAGGVFTHNHPSNSSFSDGDLQHAIYWNFGEFRAVGKRGTTYSIRPRPGRSWPSWFTLQDALTAYRPHMEAARQAYARQGLDRQVSFDKALHEQWVAIARQFDLIYTREAAGAVRHGE